MKSINEVNLLGNLTRDPELRYTPNGKAVITLGMATNNSIKQADGTYLDVPEFHSVIFWGKSAEAISKYCFKGNKLFVKGRIKTRKYTDKANIERYITEILGRDFVLLTPRPAGTETVRQPVAPGTPTNSAGRPIEDIIIPDEVPNEIPTIVQDDMPF